MKQVIVLKLDTTPPQHQALLQTVEAFNRGCDYVAEVASKKRMANKIALQPFVYGTLRADYGLSSQMVVRCISKAVEACKRDKNIQPTFAPHGAKSCGLDTNADKNAAFKNAALNIQARAELSDSLLFRSNPALLA